jgi:putative transcriptional regulator
MTEIRQMTDFADDLIQSLGEAIAHAKGDGPAVVHAPLNPREVRDRVKLTQAQMAPLMGMSLSGYRKWEQGQRRISGPAAALLRVIEKEPDAVRRALAGGAR